MRARFRLDLVSIESLEWSRREAARTGGRPGARSGQMSTGREALRPRAADTMHMEVYPDALCRVIPSAQGRVPRERRDAISVFSSPPPPPPAPPPAPPPTRSRGTTHTRARQAALHLRRPDRVSSRARVGSICTPRASSAARRTTSRDAAHVARDGLDRPYSCCLMPLV
jgi:hypothetical protein